MPYDNNLSYFKRSLVFLQFIWFSTIKLFSLKADFVLATSTPLTVGIPALLKKWKDKTPYLFEVRDVWPEAPIAIGAIKNTFLKGILFYLEKIIYNNAEEIIPLSSDMELSIHKRYPKTKTKTTVIENLSVIERFQNNYDKNKKFLKNKIGFEPRFSILYAGTFGLVNNLDYVLELAKKIIKSDKTIIFILIGEGAQKEMITNKAIDYNLLNKNVFILNPISKDDLSQLYYECSMGSSFVSNIPELWANSANKFFDSLAAGRPVLINHLGWQNKIIKNENIGYVLPVILKDKDVEKFIEYSYDKALIIEQNRNALKVATENYSLDIASMKYEKIFNKLEYYISK